MELGGAKSKSVRQSSCYRMLTVLHARSDFREENIILCEPSISLLDFAVRTKAPIRNGAEYCVYRFHWNKGRGLVISA